MDKLETFNIAVHLDGLPPQIMKKVERLGLVVGTMSLIGPGDIKLLSRHQINEVRRYVVEAQTLRESLVSRDNIIQLAGQNPAWVTLDKLTIQEVNDKLQMLRNLKEADVEMQVHHEVEDVSQPRSDDDFTGEEEEGSFW